MRNDQYEFMPVNTSNENLTKPVYFTDSDPSLRSGEIRCSMHVLNSLLVGNKHEVDETKTNTQIYPLKVGNDICISPYTLKGCISSFLAQLLKAPVTRMNRVNIRKKLRLFDAGDERLQELLVGYKPFEDNEFRSVNDLHINTLRSMFGYALQDIDKKNLEERDGNEKLDKVVAQSSHVHFNYALYNKGGRLLAKPLRRLLAGSPAATNQYFYRVDTPLTQIKMKGRKVYKRYNVKPNTTSDVQSWMHEVLIYDKSVSPAYPEFRFTCRFENLDDAKLNMLLFALDFGQQGLDQSELYSHQIGYGKNFGMGAVKITVDKVILTPTRKGAASFIRDVTTHSNQLNSNEKLKNNLIFNHNKQENLQGRERYHTGD